MKELAPNTYTFAEYELDLARRLLLRAGESIPLKAKAFDLLVVLIQNRERVIAKEELMELVWQDQFVEEANLAVQISTLRRFLGEKKGEHRFIVTVPGRGYRFVAAVIDPTRLPRRRLLVMPFAGGEPVKSFAVPQSVSLERPLRWTPDGKAIMYEDSYQGLWRQALVEEKPELVKGFEEVRVFQFTWSLDGKDLTYTTGKATREIILIENFRQVSR